MILVTGATGQLGQLVVESLAARVPPTSFIAGARSQEKGAAIAARGVPVRVVDYDRPETLAAALDGVETVLLISGSELGSRLRQHTAVIGAAKKAGVRRIVYTSVLHADRSTLGLAKEHLATEEAIRASGLAYTFLRNGWYIENQTGNLAATLAHGTILGAANDGRFAPASRRDYAEAAAVVLTTTGHENKVYELAGDRSLTVAELAASFAEVAGKPVSYTNLPEADYAAALVGFGLPKFVADMLADSDAGLARGDLDDRSGTLRSLIGRPTTTIEAVVRDALGR